MKQAFRALEDALLVVMVRDWTSNQEAKIYAGCADEILEINETLEKEIIKARKVDINAP